MYFTSILTYIWDVFHDLKLHFMYNLVLNVDGLIYNIQSEASVAELC